MITDEQRDEKAAERSGNSMLGKAMKDQEKKLKRKVFKETVKAMIMSIVIKALIMLPILILVFSIVDFLSNDASGEDGYSDVTYDGTLTGSTVEEQTWNFLIANGATKVGAAAMMGNIYRESHFDPTLSEDYGYAHPHGLIQWTTESGRFGKLEAYANDKGTTWEDLQTQLEFMWKEITEGYEKTRNVILTANDEEKLYACDTKGKCTCCYPIIIRDDYERPGYGHSYDAQCVKERKEWAKKYYDMFKEIEPPSTEDEIGEVSGSQGGTYTNLYPNGKASVHVGIKGKFKSAITNKTFYIYYQGAPGWGTWCNRAAAICLWSGYNAANDQAAISLFNYANKAKSDINTDSQYNSHGMKRSSLGNGKYSKYKDDLRTALLNGNYGLFYITDSNYKGKSTTQWTHKKHWLVALGYQKVNGVEQIFIGDGGKLARGGWVSISEFDTANVRFYTVSKK